MASALDDDLDSACPLRHVVVCCTSIGTNQRNEIANKVFELGGVHKYDLTPDVTHLIVGEHDTAKYRHVARERPDVKSMDAGWIGALSELWKQDAPIEFAAMEAEWQLKPLEVGGADVDLANKSQDPPPRRALLCCLTGFDLGERQAIMPLIVQNGGHYTADLTRAVTHLIVKSPEGKKYQAAKSWQIATVTIEWLEQTIQRGMVLDEKYYDPTLSAAEIGVGARVLVRDAAASLLGKRARPGNSDKTYARLRKLKRSASLRLGNQGEAIWDEVLARKPAKAASAATPAHPDPWQPAETPTTGPPLKHPTHVVESHAIFTRCLFIISGFEKKQANILQHTITSLGGQFHKLASNEATPLSRDSLGFQHQFVIVPQNAQPDTYRDQARITNLPLVTELFIERCLQSNRLFPVDDHVLGRPFPLFPLPGFDQLVVCSAGFTGIKLNHIERTLTQLGAQYRETFKPATSLLVCQSPAAIRQEKLRLALMWNVPVVSEAWLWQCVSTASLLDFRPYMFPDIQPLHADRTIRRVHSDPVPLKSRALPAGMASLPQAAIAAPAHPFQARQHGGPSDATDSHATFVTAQTQPEPILPAPPPAPAEPPAVAALDPSSRQQSPAEPTTYHPPSPAPPPDAHGSNHDSHGAGKPHRATARKQQRLLDRALSTELASLIAGVDAGTEPPPDAGQHPRRKQIMGRATSNVSTASTAGDAAAAAAAVGGTSGPQPPPSTQIGYRDSAAEMHREAVIKRMMSGASDVAGQAVSLQ